MTDDSYDYDANCRHWPDAAVNFPWARSSSRSPIRFEALSTHRSRPSRRRLYVRAWYPAGDVTGCARRPYFTDAEVGTVPVMSLQSASATARRAAERGRGS